MSSPIQSLIQSGTKLWLDSIDPRLVAENRALGATGATSNPIIIADLINSGRFDQQLQELSAQHADNDSVAWAMTDQLVTDAQSAFQDVWQATDGNDGYVSFELDPLLEDPDNPLSHDERVEQYIQLGLKWSQGHTNRMIKVPATPAGLDSLETLAANGVALNVTLVFSDRQYVAARDAVWRGAQKLDNLEHFKSVYSIFVSRIDVYTEKHCPDLTEEAQGQVGIVNAKRIWEANREFWQNKSCPHQQEIIFASTGTKKPSDPPWKYVQALAGSDIQTNPPATNDAVQSSDVTFHRAVDQLPSDEVLSNIDSIVDFAKMEKTLMEEGIAKFADPQKALLELLDEKRKMLTA